MELIFFYIKGIDTDDIGNLQDSRRLAVIDEECENLIIVNDGGERTRNITQNNKSGILQQSIDVQHVTNALSESISSITMWNIVNQLGKLDFFLWGNSK